jgi:protein-disulfide isomerase
MFSMLLAGACKAQSVTAPFSTDVTFKIEARVREQYNVPPMVKISLSAPKPSDVPGYDQFTVTFTGSASDTTTKTTTFDFLISKDRNTLGRLEKMDLSKVDLPRDLMAKIGVKGRPVRGNPEAKVTVVNFDDFQCPYCSRMHAVLFPAMLKAYGDRVKIIYRDYPLVEIHPWAMHAAIDANCLADQSPEAYWDFADYVHANQRAISGKTPQEAFANLDVLITDQATKHHLDVAKIQACVNKQDDSAVRASMAEAEKIGVDSTPTLFINGERISGAVPDAAMRTLLDHALIEAGQPAPASSAKK